MILFQFNNDILNHIKQKLVVVHDYTVRDDRLTIILEDKAVIGEDQPRFIKLQFNKFKLTDEIFEIKGMPIESALIKEYVRFYNAKYFVAQALVVSNSAKPDEKITITGV